jgi:hypothetical protein
MVTTMKRILFSFLILGALIAMATSLFNNNGNIAQARSPLSIDSDQNNPVNVTKGGALGGQGGADCFSPVPWDNWLADGCPARHGKGEAMG